MSLCLRWLILPNTHSSENRFNFRTGSHSLTRRLRKRLLKQGTEKILVVDDDAAIRWSLAEALKSWGYVTADAGTVAVLRRRLREGSEESVRRGLFWGWGRRANERYWQARHS